MTITVDILFVLVIFGCASAKFQWKDCGSKGGKVTDVNVVGCESSTFSCDLTRGKNASFSIDFDSKEVATKLTAVVHGIIASIPVPFPLDNPDACKNSNIICPTENGKHYTYQSTIFVKDSYPKISLAVKWELQDEKGADVACVVIPAKIV